MVQAQDVGVGRQSHGARGRQRGFSTTSQVGFLRVTCLDASVSDSQSFFAPSQSLRFMSRSVGCSPRSRRASSSAFCISLCKLMSTNVMTAPSMTFSSVRYG